MLSPPCTTFSTLRRLSDYKRDFATVEQERQEGLMRWHFCLYLARLQHDARRGFLLEHPHYAESWKDEAMEHLMLLPGVFHIYVDMCAFQLYTDGGRAKKPTALLTNIWPLVRLLRKHRCAGDHDHQPLLGGGRAALAAQYTTAFVRAVLQGLRRHLQGRGIDYVHVSEAPMNLPDELQSKANYYAKSMAQPVADYIQEESSFQYDLYFVDYHCTAFPAHRILGEEQAVLPEKARYEIRPLAESDEVQELARDLSQTRSTSSLAPDLRREVFWASSCQLKIASSGRSNTPT